MTVTLYSATVPTYLQILPAVLGLVAKAEAFCETEGTAPAELITAQLAPDMWDLAMQVYAVTLHSAVALKGALAGEFAPTFPAPPADFAGLRTLLEDALEAVKAVTPDQINALAGRETHFRLGQRHMEFTNEDFLLSFSAPNFYFHASTIYGILRMKGVAVGKNDFVGAVRKKPTVPA